MQTGNITKFQIHVKATIVTCKSFFFYSKCMKLIFSSYDKTSLNFRVFQTSQTKAILRASQKIDSFEQIFQPLQQLSKAINESLLF